MPYLYNIIKPLKNKIYLRGDYIKLLKFYTKQALEQAEKINTEYIPKLSTGTYGFLANFSGFSNPKVIGAMLKLIQSIRILYRQLNTVELICFDEQNLRFKTRFAQYGINDTNKLDDGNFIKTMPKYIEKQDMGETVMVVDENDPIEVICYGNKSINFKKLVNLLNTYVLHSISFYFYSDAILSTKYLPGIPSKEDYNKMVGDLFQNAYVTIHNILIDSIGVDFTQTYSMKTEPFIQKIIQELDILNIVIGV